LAAATIPYAPGNAGRHVQRPQALDALVFGQAGSWPGANFIAAEMPTGVFERGTLGLPGADSRGAAALRWMEA
jgi:hypothetical protein